MKHLLLLAAAALLLPATAQAQSLYSDPIARQQGDILTVILAEQTSAQRESGYEDESGSSVRGRGDVSAPGIGSRFSADARFDLESSTRNETVQSDLLEGTLTTRVVETDEAGNLVIEGERRLNVNGVTHLMKVSGTVRPYDIRYNNTVLSHQIAGANVVYRKVGLGRQFLAPGTFAKIGAVGAIVAAVVLGL